MVFTSLPLGTRALLDHDVKPDDGEVIEKLLPFMYMENRDNPVFTIKKFIMTLVKGVIHCCINFYFVIYSLNNGIFDHLGNDPGLWVISVSLFTNILLIVSIDLIIFTKYHTWWNFWILLIITFVAYILFVILVHNWNFFNSVGTMVYTFTSWRIWLIFLLVCGTCALIDFGVLAYDYYFNQKISTVMELLFSRFGRVDDETDIPEYILDKLKVYCDYGEEEEEDYNDVKERKKKEEESNKVGEVTQEDINDLKNKKSESDSQNSKITDDKKNSSSDKNSKEDSDSANNFLDNKKKGIFDKKTNSIPSNSNCSIESSSRSMKKKDENSIYSNSKLSKYSKYSKSSKNSKNNLKKEKENTESYKSYKSSNYSKNTKSGRNSKNDIKLKDRKKYNTVNDSSSASYNKSDKVSFEDVDIDFEKDIPKKPNDYVDNVTTNTHVKSSLKNNNEDIGENYEVEYSENMSNEIKNFSPEQSLGICSSRFKKERPKILHKYNK